MKKILQITLWIIILAGIGVIFGFAVTEQRRASCTGIAINIMDGDKPGFITTEEVNRLVRQLCGDVVGKHLDSINTSLIAESLRKNPYIREAHVYKSIPGELRVKLTRSTALVRVINRNGHGFYIGTKGEILPLSNTFVPRTIIASGHIDAAPAGGGPSNIFNPENKIKSKELLAEIFSLALTLRDHPIFHDAIEQIWVNAKGEFELVPASGGHVIAIGSTDNIETKLENLLAFYQAGAPKINLDDFKIIDLKYNDLVVCKK